MKEAKIKKVLREATVKKSKSSTKSDDSVEDKKIDNISTLLSNDIINHAAIVRKMTGEDWVGNSEATNRSKFRKKFNKLSNDEGSMYSFDDEEVSQIEKILMNLSSTITSTIGNQGK
jgi:hypothetical protein